VGAIFMAENLEIVADTFDTKHHFVVEHIVNDSIKIIFVKLLDYYVNIVTQRVSKDTYTKDVSNFFGKIEDS
jgi:hypothetical protein